MYRLLVFFLFISWVAIAQDVKLLGDFNTGSVIFGVGNGIKYAYLDTIKLDVEEGKYFTFGFDRDDTAVHHLKVKLDDGLVVLKKFKPEQVKYNIQRINNIQRKHVTPPKSESERIARERNISRTARAKIGEVKEAFFLNGFQRPIRGGRISGVFGSQRILNGKPRNIHNGLDIAVPRGTPVHAMSDGFVILSADTFFYAGNNILIDHGQGLNSFYLHLSKMDVKEGEFVKKGQKIGEVGTTGRSTGPHLHWGVQWFEKRVDPAGLLKINLDEE